MRVRTVESGKTLFFIADGKLVVFHIIRQWNPILISSAGGRYTRLDGTMLSTSFRDHISQHPQITRCFRLTKYNLSDSARISFACAVSGGENDFWFFYEISSPPKDSLSSLQHFLWHFWHIFSLHIFTVFWARNFLSSFSYFLHFFLFSFPPSSKKTQRTLSSYLLSSSGEARRSGEDFPFKFYVLATPCKRETSPSVALFEANLQCAHGSSAIYFHK